MPVIELTHTLDGAVAAQRGKWQAVKTKHAAAIKAKKINFNKNLGALLDKRKGLYKSIRAWKKGDSLLGVRANLSTLKANAKQIETIVKAYQKAITGLGDPAEKELRQALTKIQNEVVQVDIAFVAAKSKAK
jgi:hypothetical protein